MVNRRWLLILVAVLVALLVIVAVVLLRRGGPSPKVATPPSDGTAAYEVLFTTPQRTGIPPDGSSGRLDLRLVALIDAAQRSIDLAVYDFGLQNVADALLRAKARGVRVRVVTDSDNLANPPLQRLIQDGIGVVADHRSALMHHKFIVLDGATLMTGAWNVAERDTYRHNNNSVVFRSPELAANFTREFEKMYVERRFGPTKPTDIPNPVVQLGGTRVETYFASEQDVVPAILSRIAGARESVAMLAFSFTLDSIGDALRGRAQAGVGVWSVIESTGSETAASEFGRLRSLTAPSARPPFPGCGDGPAVLQDGNPYLLHHKVIVIDARTVVFGSFNFTNNAERDNDEALLIVDDPALATQFLTEFCRVYNVATGRARSKR